jgi:hypothetical protein
LKIDLQADYALRVQGRLTPGLKAALSPFEAMGRAKDRLPLPHLPTLRIKRAIVPHNATTAPPPALYRRMSQPGPGRAGKGHLPAPRLAQGCLPLHRPADPVRIDDPDRSRDGDGPRPPAVERVTGIG